MLRTLGLCWLTGLLFACETQPTIVPKPQPPAKIKKGILFLGHTYRWHTASDRVDERIEQLDLSGYEQIWLGGDICSETTQEPGTLDYLDDLFDLSAPTTLWAPGNHDVRNGNLDWLRAATGRELHYVQNFPGMTVIVTNTNYKGNTECEAWLDQFEMIQNVCDSLTNASHLVLLTHHLVWTDVEPGMNADSIANAGAAWLPWRCQNGTQFRFSVYPLLKQVQARGIQVVVISGDAGQQKQKYYQHQASSGIWFLASGINNSFEKDSLQRTLLPPDRLLYMEYDTATRQLDWNFPNLDSLLHS